MNAIDAVEIVLADAGEPLGYREITRRVLEQGLWQTEGLTPEATIHARLGTDIKDLRRGITVSAHRAGGVCAAKVGAAGGGGQGREAETAQGSRGGGCGAWRVGQY